MLLKNLMHYIFPHQSLAILIVCTSHITSFSLSPQGSALCLSESSVVILPMPLQPLFPSLHGFILHVNMCRYFSCNILGAVHRCSFLPVAVAWNALSPIREPQARQTQQVSECLTSQI